MHYNHTQRGQFHKIFLIVAAIMLVGSLIARADVQVVWLLLGITAVFIICAMLFGSLTVRGEGDRLVLRYGPVPLLRKSIRYAGIRAATPAKSKVIDGWGIHYVPGRGWTYNIWGYDCVELTIGKSIVRIGTDDVDGLSAHLMEKLPRDHLSSAMDSSMPRHNTETRS
jgi:hypothetical protein